MRADYSYDIIDGREVPPLVLDRDAKLAGGHRGSVYVERASVTVTGLHQGSLSLGDDAEVRIVGTHQGSSHVGAGCVLRIIGTDQGSLYVAPGGEVVVELTGQQQGSVHNDGRYLLEGTRGGSLGGSGTYLESHSARVREPVMRNGIAVYEWRRSR